MIITSRNPDWPGTLLEVQEFTRTESIQALRSQVPRLTDEDANRLASALGDLLQAVDRAATFLADTGLTEEISRAVRSGRADEVLEVLALDPAQPFGSWSEAFDQLDDHDPIAVELLTLLAWLALNRFRSPGSRTHGVWAEHRLPRRLDEPEQRRDHDPLSIGVTVHGDG